MRPIPTQAVDFIAEHEGLRLAAYPDPATNGPPWTIGFGHTGPDVSPGLVITLDRAKALLKDDLRISAQRIEARIGDVVQDLTENQYAALLSFVFNLGATPSWTIWKRLKARQYDQVPAEMAKFVNANGKKMLGLVKRRAAEQVLWATDEPGSDDFHLTSAATREGATPPTVADPVPAKKSASVWAAITAPIVTLFAGIGQWLDSAPAMIKQALNAIDPFSDKSPIVANAVMGLSTLAALLGLYVAWKTVSKKAEARS